MIDRALCEALWLATTHITSQQPSAILKDDVTLLEGIYQ